MLSRAITIELDVRDRAAAKASRRFPAAISSDTPITRRSWDGDWTEVLEHSARAVDLARSPLPVLESHDRSKVNLGIVENLRVTGGKLRGEVVFGNSQRATELAADVADGIVRSLSVGYEILEQTRDEKAKRITATKWRPHEVSIVSTPADTSVGFGRSHTVDEHEQQTHTTPAATSAAEPTAPSSAVLAERERVTTISDLVARTHLGADFGAQLITRGVALDQARNAILNELARRDEAIPTHSHIAVIPGGAERQGREAIVPGADYTEDFRRAAIDALLLRAGVPVERPHAAAQDIDPSVYAIARTCLSRAGRPGSRWFSGEARGPELLKRAAGTGDFPAILEGALHASVRSGYELEPASHRRWVRVAPFTDFRPASRPILGSAPDLEKVLEHGEYTHGYFSDEGTSYTIQKYGKIVALTWESLLADNLGAFLRVQPALGQAARRLEADVVYALFGLNAGAGPAMPDGSNLFVAGHANLVTAGAFDTALLGAARTLLRKQKALGGGYMALTPRFWIVPAERETAAEVILANASRRTTTEKNTPEWISNLELVVEPRLASGAAFLAADSAQVDHVELGLLEENMSGPYIEIEQGFGTDESRWKIRHTAGAKVLDWRGLVRMPITP